MRNFFASPKMFVLGVTLTIVGAYQLMMGLSYRQAAEHEASTTGVITRVHHGKGTTYYFTFTLKGAPYQDSSGLCKTALTTSGCEEGASVRVYYDAAGSAGSLLQEFGEAARERLLFAGWTLGFGVPLLGIYLFLDKFSPDSGESDQSDDDSQSDPEALTTLSLKE